MSGSYYSDYQIIAEFTAITLGGHTPDEETMDILKDMNPEHRKEMGLMLEAWTKAIKGE
jgi:hypothetical protein